MDDKLSLKGHSAMITGGAQGIGKEIALTLLKQGACVTVVDINRDSLNDVEQELNDFVQNRKFVTVQADVTSIPELESAVQKAIKCFGDLDILINNAGILHSTPLEDVTEQEWDRIIDVNLKSFFFAVQKSIPTMKKKGWGRIVNISSLAGRMGGISTGLAYSASKSGVIGLSRGMALRLADYGITVNCIAPGTTESDILKKFTEEDIVKLRNTIPLGRLGQPKDIAELALFLSSEMSGFITGATIDINGGMYMG